eukprot:ANDGO_00532.mRNA.1 hypothetical protein
MVIADLVLSVPAYLNGKDAGYLSLISDGRVLFSIHSHLVEPLPLITWSLDKSANKKWVFEIDSKTEKLAVGSNTFFKFSKDVLTVLIKHQSFFAQFSPGKPSKTHGSTPPTMQQFLEMRAAEIVSSSSTSPIPLPCAFVSANEKVAALPGMFIISPESCKVRLASSPLVIPDPMDMEIPIGPDGVVFERDGADGKVIVATLSERRGGAGYHFVPQKVTFSLPSAQDAESAYKMIMQAAKLRPEEPKPEAKPAEFKPDVAVDKDHNPATEPAAVETISATNEGTPAAAQSTTSEQECRKSDSSPSAGDGGVGSVGDKPATARPDDSTQPIVENTDGQPAESKPAAVAEPAATAPARLIRKVIPPTIIVTFVHDYGETVMEVKMGGATSPDGKQDEMTLVANQKTLEEVRTQWSLGLLSNYQLLVFLNSFSPDHRSKPIFPCLLCTHAENPMDIFTGDFVFTRVRNFSKGPFRTYEMGEFSLAGMPPLDAEWPPQLFDMKLLMEWGQQFALPLWCTYHDQWCFLMRRLLESNYVSYHLGSWITAVGLASGSFQRREAFRISFGDAALVHKALTSAGYSFATDDQPFNEAAEFVVRTGAGMNGLVQAKFDALEQARKELQENCKATRDAETQVVDEHENTSQQEDPQSQSQGQSADRQAVVPSSATEASLRDLKLTWVSSIADTEVEPGSFSQKVLALAEDPLQPLLINLVSGEHTKVSVPEMSLPKQQFLAASCSRDGSLLCIISYPVRLLGYLLATYSAPEGRFAPDTCVLVHNFAERNGALFAEAQPLLRSSQDANAESSATSKNVQRFPSRLLVPLHILKIRDSNLNLDDPVTGDSFLEIIISLVDIRNQTARQVRTLCPRRGSVNASVLLDGISPSTCSITVAHDTVYLECLLPDGVSLRFSKSLRDLGEIPSLDEDDVLSSQERSKWQIYRDSLRKWAPVLDLSDREPEIGAQPQPQPQPHVSFIQISRSDAWTETDAVDDVLFDIALRERAEHVADPQTPRAPSAPRPPVSSGRRSSTGNRPGSRAPSSPSQYPNSPRIGTAEVARPFVETSTWGTRMAQEDEFSNGDEHPKPSPHGSSRPTSARPGTSHSNGTKSRPSSARVTKVYGISATAVQPPMASNHYRDVEDLSHQIIAIQKNHNVVVQENKQLRTKLLRAAREIETRDSQISYLENEYIHLQESNLRSEQIIQSMTLQIASLQARKSKRKYHS